MNQILPTALDVANLPPVIRASPSAVSIWYVLEYRARGVLLVHGSLAHEVMTCSSTDVQGVIGAMVDVGVLIPIAVDIAGASKSVRVLSDAAKCGTRYILQHPWCRAHACFWTYRPGNTSPMPYDATQHEVLDPSTAHLPLGLRRYTRPKGP